jgi:hypothetical protein
MMVMATEMKVNTLGRVVAILVIQLLSYEGFNAEKEVIFLMRGT